MSSAFVQAERKASSPAASSGVSSGRRRAVIDPSSSRSPLPNAVRRPANPSPRSSRRRGPAVALGAALALCAAALPAAAGRPDRFLISGWGTGDASTNLERLVRIDGAGIDFVFNMDHQTDLPLGLRLAAQVDSMRAARRDFKLRVLYVHNDPGDPEGRVSGNADVAKHGPAMRRTLARLRGAGPGSAQGWFLADEPCTRAQMNVIGTTVRALAADPKTANELAYVNLIGLPSEGCYGPDFGGGRDRRAAYANYLHSYLALFDGMPEPAPLLSFDLYPFIDDARMNPSWFENLQLVRDAAAGAGRAGKRVPMWVVIQLASFRPHGGPTMRNPDTAQIRWQAWTAIAYGAKGLSYWTLGDGIDHRDSTGYMVGLLDPRGRPTGKYETVKALNARLHALGPILMELDPLAAFHVAVQGQQGIDAERLGSPAQVYGIVRGVSGDGAENCLVGYFKHRATHDDYLVVVNKDLRAAHRFELALPFTPRAVDRYDAAGRPKSETPSAKLTVPLGPADAVLLRLKSPVYEAIPNVRKVTRNGGKLDYVLASGKVLEVDPANGTRLMVDRARGETATEFVPGPTGVTRPTR